MHHNYLSASRALFLFWPCPNPKARSVFFPWACVLTVVFFPWAWIASYSANMLIWLANLVRFIPNITQEWTWDHGSNDQLSLSQLKLDGGQVESTPTPSLCSSDHVSASSGFSASTHFISHCKRSFGRFLRAFCIDSRRSVSHFFLWRCKHSKNLVKHKLPIAT